MFNIIFISMLLIGIMAIDSVIKEDFAMNRELENFKLRKELGYYPIINTNKAYVKTKPRHLLKLN